MAGTNAYYSRIQVPTPTLEVCKDPAKLADLLSKMQQQLNMDYRRFRVVKCPNVANVYKDIGAGTVVSIQNPGFPVGAVFFSHAIPTKTGDGMVEPAKVTSAGYLYELVIQTNGPITFKPVVPSTEPGGSTANSYFDVYVVLMEGEGSVK